MTLTVTAGSATADSYASLSALDAYHSSRGNTAWTGTDDAKEAALRRATAWLDGRYAGRWPGIPVNGRLQALDWPRAYAEDVDGNDIDATTIPTEVVAATCEAALRELASPGGLSPDVTPGTVKVLTGVGDLSWTPLRTGASPGDMTPTLTIVDRLLAPIVGSASVVRVVRA